MTMNDRRLWSCMLVCCFRVVSATDAAAPPSETLWRELEPAWDVVAQKVVKLVGEERQHRMIDLAYASVGANVCGIALKRSAFEQAFEVFEDDAYRTLPEQQRKQYEQHLLVHYGTFVGLLTAEALLSRETFCGTAAELRTSHGGAAAYWGDEHSGR